MDPMRFGMPNMGGMQFAGNSAGVGSQQGLSSGGLQTGGGQPGMFNLSADGQGGNTPSTMDQPMLQGGGDMQSFMQNIGQIMMSVMMLFAQTMQMMQQMMAQQQQGGQSGSGSPDGVSGPGSGSGCSGGNCGGAGGPSGSGGSDGAGGSEGPSGGGGESGGPSGSGGAPGAGGPAQPPSDVGKPNGNVDQWIAEAQAILRAQGVPDDKMKAEDLKLIIQKESSGNPNAINNWDSNAKKGTPSIGIMQTIQPTFDANKVKGYDDIRNPVHNIVAAVRYGIKRYGSMSAVAAKKRGGKNEGY